MTKEEIKDSLNIPHTSLPIRIDAFENEKLMHDWWNDNNIYNKVLLKNKNKMQKILHDGPPYANGKLHIGHAMNKVLKDIIVRLWSMEGYYSQYVMGWDVHGLPIEHALIKLGVNTDPNMSIIEKRKNCFEFAMKNLEIQKKQFEDLGIFTDYNVYYRTSDNYIEFKQLRLVNTMINQNLIYKSLKPVYWSWSSQSALAEDEIEYKDEESDSIYVSFDMASDEFKDTSLLIWTTTPWTIPSNLAVAVHPDFDYVQIIVDGSRKYIVAKNLLENLKQQFGWKTVDIEKEFKGTKLENLKYYHPLYSEDKNPIILADYVSATEGTGLVHNAPAFGLDDYKACMKYGIGPEYCPIDNYGKFDGTVKSKELVGLFYKDANPIIIDWLEKSNHLLKKSKFTHSVAIDWRTKQPVIYRATSQWFVDLDKIRNELVRVVEDTSNNGIKFPNGEWARTNLAYMVGHRSEWCISRQRYWGVPITIIYDENNQPVLDYELISHFIDLIEKANTSDIWFSEPVEYFLTDKYKNNGHKYRKETDIMDVWFDSGATHNMFSHFGWSYPVELYIEGIDQYRGWFNSSTITGVVLHDKAPFKTVISHGFILDENGNKMSKSLGNVVDPEEIEKQYGTDIFRLWVASSNWMEDVRIGENILKQVSENYRRIRNTLFRFSLSNLYDFNPKTDYQYELRLADKYVLYETQKNLNKIKEWFDNYNFVDIVKSVTSATTNLSNWYFEIIKDSLYCDNANSRRRRQIQTTLYELLRSYMIALAPILPHLCEEVYQNAKRMFYWEEESVFLLDYIKPNALINKFFLEDMSKCEELFEIFFKDKDEIYSELEKLRTNKVISKNNEAIVTMKKDLVTDRVCRHILKDWLNVADVEIGNELKVRKSEGYNNCARCWNNYNEKLDENNFCTRCHNALVK